MLRRPLTIWLALTLLWAAHVALGLGLRKASHGDAPWTLYGHEVAAAGTPAAAFVDLWGPIVVRGIVVALPVLLVPWGLMMAAAWVAKAIDRHRPPFACPACGYDLRATPDRCPECGAKPRTT